MKSLWKRAVSLLLTFSMLLPLFPVPAFAAGEFDATVPIYSDHADEDGLSLELGDNTLTPAILAIDSTLGILTSPYQKDATEKIDLWPSSSNMVANNEDDGSVIPYVYDEAGNRWYLKEILWFDRSALNDRQTGVIMDTADIKAAAEAKDKICYVIDPATKINVPPKGITYGSGRDRVTVPAYIICYYWTTNDPNTESDITTPAETYSIQYNNGLPEELGDSFMLYRIKKGGTLDIGDSTTSRDAFQKEFGALTSTVKDGLNFIVAKNADYKGYLAFSPEKDIYYEFVGWQVTSSPNNTVYKTGDILKPVNYQVDGKQVVAFALQEDDGLAATNDIPTTVAEDGTITLTGVWSQIKLKNSFKDAPEFLLLAEKDNTAQIVQWTNDNEASATAGEITLNEDDTLYYRATVYMTNEVAGMLESKTMNNPAFAEFDITVNVDSENLVIDDASINTNGDVTAEFVCPFLTPTAVVVDGEGITGASFALDPSKENAHTITVPASAITNENGTLKPFTIHVQWIAGKNHTYSTLKQPMTLTSFGLVLKTGADGKVENPDLTLSTSGVVNGTIDFTLTNRRVLYQAASALLNSKGDWQEYFEGDGSTPTALVNASRYIQAIGSNNAQLTANTVTAKYGEPVPETYKVTLVTNGGTILKNDVTQYTAGEKVNLPFTEEEITREGYIFQGWYTDQNYSDDDPILSIEATDTGDKIYYAKWEKKPDDAPVFSVFLIKNGGTFAEGKQLTQYTAGEDTPLPTDKDITREGYTFKGWYRDEELTDGPVELIEATERGCKVFFARWEPAAAPAPSEPAQSVSDDGSALLGLGIVLAGGAAALTYHYRAFLPIWKYVGIVKLADEDGTPVPNATVTLFQDGEEVKSVTTNDDGYFETRVPKGDYEVVVTWERDGVEYTERTEATVDRVAGDIRPQEIILNMEQLPEGMA